MSEEEYTLSREDIHHRLELVNDKIWTLAYKNTMTNRQKKKLAEEVWLDVDTLRGYMLKKK